MPDMDCRARWEACQRDPIILEALRGLRASLGAEGCSLLLIDEAAGEMCFAVSDGLNGQELTGAGEWPKAFRVSLSAARGINSTAALMGKALCFHEMDDRHNPSVDLAFAQKTHSVLAIPLVVGESVVATLSAINPHAAAHDETRFRFSDTDMQTAHGTAAVLTERLAAHGRGAIG
ncbi:hypothetical protein BH09SUM1_BH09SUM1_32410 [soil metagenome]